MVAPPDHAPAPPAGRPPMRGGSLLLGMLRARRGRVAISALAGMSHEACEALVPAVLGVIVDRAIAPSDGGRLVLWVGVPAVLFVLLNGSCRTQFRVGVRALEQSEHDLRMALCDRILDPGGIDVDHRRARSSLGAGAAGELLSIAGSDARRAALVPQGVMMAAAALAALVAAAVVLVQISVPLGLLVLLGTPPLVFLLHRVAGPLHRHSGAEQAALRAAAPAASSRPSTCSSAGCSRRSSPTWPAGWRWRARSASATSSRPWG